MNRLETLIRQKIAETGAITVAEYMTHCLSHPEHGYYIKRDPLGRAGDFVTAPEISQIFGEMIGAWLAQVWFDQGRPTSFVLAEAGPGRGTLMHDILRVCARQQGFMDAASVCLIESSPVLKTVQQEKLSGYDVVWLESVHDLPDGPLFLVANEFFDALPVLQYQRADTHWRPRLVDTRGDKLTFLWGAPEADPRLDARFNPVPDGTVVEVCPAAEQIAAKISARIAGWGGAALFIDYGEWDGSGDTLQAVRHHARADILHEPGDADLTAHVRFRALADASRGARISGPERQGRFLERLGISARAEILSRKLSGNDLDSLISAHRRLTHPDEMGNLFKVLGIVVPSAPHLPGFDT